MDFLAVVTMVVVDRRLE